MALTRSVKDTIEARAERDPAFRNALLTEAVEQFLAGDVETGKALLRVCGDRRRSEGESEGTAKSPRS